MSGRRIWLLGLQALREAVHLRLAWLLVLAALVFGAGVSALADFNFGLEEARFFGDLTEGILMFFGTAQAILLAVTLVQGGLQRGAPGLLFTRGVRRSEWLVACLLAVWVTLAWLTLAAYAILALVLIWHGGAPTVTLAAACFSATVRLGLVACFALATSALSRSPLLATTLALALTVAAHLAPIISWAATHGRAATRPVWRLLGDVVPNFAALEPGASFAAILGQGAGYAALYTFLACQLFAHREL
jgi:ABC-type transport system involved in multi-copper enzyme maturation permease subunit